jgi:DNA polymerase
MAWTERQRRMLQAMGLTVWQPAAAETAPAADLAVLEAAPPAPAPAAAPAPAIAPATAPARPAAAPPAAAPQAPRAAEAAPPSERARHIATLDWPALREAVAGCRACGLCEQRRQTVFGVGHPQARWMIIGEAPGEQEDRQGEPFVGAAGQLLDRMLAALDLTRAEADAQGSAGPERRVFIANTLKCRPPGNRNPEPAELAACEPFLRRQLALVRPRIILAMGRFAVQSLLQTGDAIGKLRGRLHTLPGDAARTPVVVTYHPAYLLRNPADKSRAWADLCLARSVAGRA